MTTATSRTKPSQLRLTRRSPAYWRVTIDNPPINLMGPEMVRQFQQVINALEADEQVRVVVFDSSVDDYFLELADHLRSHDVDRRVVDGDTPIGGRPPGQAELCGFRWCVGGGHDFS